MTDSLFSFSVSPDDQWIVFFKDLTEDQIGTRHFMYGNLCLFNLKTNTLESITLSENVAPDGIDIGDACWHADSTVCVLPPPTDAKWVPKQAIIINLSDPNAITVTSATVDHGPSRSAKPSKGEYRMPDEYSCSDCWPRMDDVELMKRHIDAKFLSFDTLPINRNSLGEQIVSPDAAAIFFQKGRKTSEVSLFRYDIATGQERELTSHKGECVRLGRLRLSPDGRRLAYQLTSGCDFIGPRKVYVLDVESGDKEYVGEASGGTMHWTSTSDRLFFHRDDRLHVASFPESRRPPARAPATQPAASSPTSAPATRPQP